MVLVMEFAAGGELYDYLSERKVLSEEEARRVFRQISTAVYYCHKHKICHRDLKLENILLDENGNAKVSEPPKYFYFPLFSLLLLLLNCDKIQWRRCRSLFVHFMYVLFVVVVHSKHSRDLVFSHFIIMGFCLSQIFFFCFQI